MPFDLGNYGQLGSGGGGMSSMQWVQLVGALTGAAKPEESSSTGTVSPGPWTGWTPPPTPSAGANGGQAAPPPPAVGGGSVPGSWNSVVGGTVLNSPRAGVGGGGYKPYVPSNGGGGSSY